ncbi:MAG: hypothetical protein KBT03_04850 [Bacteroidales bacterium]|nr:hypothetical protein [Candidatus Scybalousia scybalohippi]
MKNRVKKADEKLTRYAQIEMDLVYFGTCIVLNKDYGWQKKRLKRLVDVAGEIFTECSGMDKSLVEMCQDETGIEFRNRKGESWEEKPYLSTAVWGKMQDKFYSMPRHMQQAWMIRMKKCQEDWMRAQIMASVAMALHRKELWGYSRISKFVQLVEESIADFNDDNRAMLEEVNTRTGLRYSYTQSHELVLLNAREIEGEDE